MSAEILSHEIRQRAVGAGVLAVILGAFGALALAIADALGGFIEEMTAGFPEVLSSLLGSDTPGGYVVGEMFNLVFPIAVVAFAVIVGAGALAGEERDGTMSLLSAQPVTRTRLLWAKAAGIVLALIAVVGVNWAVMAAFIAADATELTLTGLTAGTIHLFFLGLAFGAVAFAIAAATGRPALASAVAGGIAVAAYLIAAMLPMVGLDAWAKTSPWYYYLANSTPLRDGINLADLGIFAAIIVVSMTVAALVFPRRDLKG